MAFLKNLEERFEQKMEDIYGRARDMKDSAALHPIFVVRPDDPNRPQGTEDTARTVPIRRVARDEERMTAFLTSPRGVKWLVTQQLLQTGNAISETRLINPLFVNLNLTPNAHFKRQLTDQTDVSLGSSARSPASTPEIGLAGRLQKETADSATIKITSRNTGRSILSVLGGQIGNTLSSTLGIGGNIGTLGINERPELMIGPKSQYYSVLLREGYTPFAQRELDILTDALSAAGAVGSIFGLPDVFSGADPFVNPLPSQTAQMRYGITDASEAIRYLSSSITPSRPILLSPTSTRITKAVRGVNLIQSGFFAASLAGSSAVRKVVTSLSAAQDDITQIFSAGTNQIPNNVPQTEDLISDLSDRSKRKIANELSFPEFALENRYNTDNRTKFIREALAEQATLIERYTDSIGTEEFPNRGIQGGITLEKLKQINIDKDANRDPFESTERAQQYFGSLQRRTISPNTDKTAPGYYRDRLNDIVRLKSKDSDTPGRLPREIKGTETPVDYINVSIFDRRNDRLEPFRAILMGLSETTTPEFTSNRYIGRLERNLVYQGATRSLTFSLYVHAWSPEELRSIWDKVNFITGLAFPAGVSNDGFLLPPIAELTIGDMYINQPGYFSNINHSIEDGTSWEVDEGAQVPMTVLMNLTYDIIEKESMVSSSPFYSFGVPVTSTK